VSVSTCAYLSVFGCLSVSLDRVITHGPQYVLCTRHFNFLLSTLSQSETWNQWQRATSQPLQFARQIATPNRKRIESEWRCSVKTIW